MRETPAICESAHAHTVYGLGNLNVGNNIAGTMTLGGINQLATNDVNSLYAGDFTVVRPQRLFAQAAALPAKPPKKEKPMSTPTRRFVQVFIADADENVPLDQSMLYTGDPKLTDATDQELFYEIDIKTILAEHNAKRVTLVNKKVKERTELLEPARIRDLKMVVVNIASF